MGGAKNRQIEQWEAGHSMDLAEEFRGVCPDCIADDGLRRFVASHAEIQHCDFCGGPGPQGLDVGTLFDYMGTRIATEWDRAIDTLFFGDGGEAWETAGAALYDGYDLLDELDDPLANEELREIFAAAFVDDRVSCHAFRLAPHERLAYGWEDFARFVREDSRYLFLRTGRSPKGDEERIPPAELLDEVALAIETGNLIRRLPSGRRLYRARQHLPGEVLATPAALGSPPAGRAGANRMSPPGISMFYGSEDPLTALTELRLGALPGTATVGTWTTARPLRYLDLVGVKVPSLFEPDEEELSQRRWRIFLKRFAEELSLPPHPGGEAIDYVPTQVFTEYVRHVLGHREDPVQGIRYCSAVRPEGVSWVLFVDAGGCTKASPGWETDPEHLLGLDVSSLRHFQATPSWTEAR